MPVNNSDFGADNNSLSNALTFEDAHLDDRIAEIAAFIDGPALRTHGASVSNLTFNCNGVGLNHAINTNYHF
jgi:hypothetical protein